MSHVSSSPEGVARPENLPRAPRLVVLAAGLGSRYGGAKQTDPVGPDGSWLLDHTLAEAMVVGFGHAVVVVRPEIRDEVAEHLDRAFRGALPLTLVDQTLRSALPDGVALPEDLLASRRKPWGTAHAVLAARSALDGPFAVANADDLYGSQAFRILRGALTGCEATAGDDGPPTWGLVGYRLDRTLSAHGRVNRGLVDADRCGWVRGVREALEIRREDGAIVGSVGGETRELPPDTRVSMNLWGFTPAVLPLLEEAFRGFLEDTVGGGDAARDAELLLPDVVGRAVARGEARVRLLPCDEPWVGMTHPEDRPAVAVALARRGPPRIPWI